MQKLLQVPVHILRIHVREDSIPSYGGRGSVSYISSLYPNPKKLNILWNKYEVGIGGRNQSKVFSPLERDQVEEKYLNSKLVWDLVSSLVLAGQSSHTFIKNIYYVYGHVSVT